MQPSQILMGKVYAVWMSRKLCPVLITGRNPSGSYYGRVYPGGRNVRVKNAAAISEQLATEATAAPVMDYKSRAAGEREGDN